MENVLANFSTNLADLAERAGHSAVAIEARHRIGSSGILWKPGFIVTAEHAIRREEGIPVILPTATGAAAGTHRPRPRYPTSPFSARRRLRSRTHLRALVIETGAEIVLAVGRHGPGVLAAMGIVSTAAGPWKTWRGGQLDSLLRLDIGAYPRSSGSAVIDTQGRFAGMLTTGLTGTAPVAIPTATIERIAAELVAHGRVARGYLGVGLQPILLPAAYAGLLNRTQRSGVMVLSVEPNGPAEDGGILLGDVIVEIGGQPVTDTDDVQIALRGSIGRELPVVVLRGGQRTELGVTTGERPEFKRPR